MNPTVGDAIIRIVYLIAASCFILGLRREQSPATAREGNWLASLGMLIAVVTTLFVEQIVTPVEMIAGMAIGGIIGVVLARRVEMTAMPELVATFNGFGGLASALVAGAEIPRFITANAPPEGFTGFTGLTVALSILIGTVTFSGSFVAFGKLSGRVTGNPVSFPGMRVLSVGVLLAVIAAIFYLTVGSDAFPSETAPVIWSAVALGGLALVLGVLLVIPIGGADMPVVVSLLNSYSGIAAAVTGFVLDNVVLIVSGTLVGAAGLILTKIMCEAMNRSLTNVLLGGFGGEALEGPSVEGAIEGRTASETTPDDAAILLSYAQQVIIVPGYGMALAQAQHQVRELADLLQEQGVTVKYAIHPVAGRMPGHMNVLLAEANVPYDQLFEMDEINNEFSVTDVALIVGANDVVNPAARTDKGSPIYGMPILNVDNAETVIVLKRSLRPGYAGVENELFYLDNTRMLFGDAKDSVGEMVSEVKTLVG